jgi:flavin-dependent dehydrogenase
VPDDPRPGADDTFDVVVVGGGPAGCAAAVTLANDGRSVLVLDNGRRGPGATPEASDREPPVRIGEGGPPGLDRAVDQVFGPGAFVRDDHLVSFGNRSAWGSETPVDTDFMFNPFGPGWHLDRLAFDDRLRARAERAGATRWFGTLRTDVARDEPDALQHDRAGRWHRERRWTLAVETPAGTREVDTSLVLDASGRGATFARRHGGQLVTRDRLVAGVAVFDAAAGPAATATGSGAATGAGAPVVADDVDSTTTLEATEGGWWYTAAIPRRRRVVAFFSDGDLLPLDLRTVDGFERHLARSHLVGPLVRGSAQRYELRSPTMLCFAGTAWLERPSGPGWLATGDAAAHFDPLSSQGILTAVLMGRTAGDAAISLLVDPDAGTDAYDERYRAIIDRFLLEHRTTYALEQRWPDAPFWSRRHDPA